MGYGWQELIWSGFVATTLAAVTMWVPRSFAWTRLNPTSQLGCLVFSDPRDPRTETLGLVLLFSLGAGLFPIVYAAVLPAAGYAAWSWGAAAGAVHGLIVAAVLPLWSQVSACARAGFPPPGHLGLGWGRATPFVLVVGHAVYGAALALALAAFSAGAGSLITLA
jgi:hypothetical protein